jgi:hypothetical protein
LQFVAGKTNIVVSQAKDRRVTNEN